MNTVNVQVQDTGVWSNVRSCSNDSQIILTEMRNVKEIYPDLRVRAVDKDGRLIDMI